MITLSSIPANSLRPAHLLEFDLWSGANGLPLNKQRLGIIAQKLAAGTAAALQPVRVITKVDAGVLFGFGSIAYRMVMAALRVYSSQEIWVIPQVDDGAATAAAGNITLTGTATGPGVLTMEVGYDILEVGVVTGDTATTLAIRARAALNAAVELPVSFAGATGVLAATFRNKGTCGNGFHLGGSCTAAGISVASSDCSCGATDPDIQSAYDAAATMRLHVITPWSGGQTDIAKGKNHIETVSGPVEKKAGRVFAVVPSTTTVSAAIAIAQAINHERVVVSMLPGSRSPTWEIAAAYGITEALMSDPAEPTAGKILPGIHAPAPSSRLLGSEVEALLAGGIAPLTVSDDAVQIERSATTRTSHNGMATLRLIDTNTIAILDYYRDSCLARYATKFKGKKQTPYMLTAVNEENYAVAKLLEDRNILRDLHAHRAEFLSEDDSDISGRIRCSMPGPIVPGLYQLFGKINLILPTDG
ncbi:MAG: hypothetical protein AAB214_18515 [Fibrobacterota bacterium]